MGAICDLCLEDRLWCFGVSEERTGSVFRVTKLVQVVAGVTSLHQEDETVSSLENACCSFHSGRG